MNALPVSCFSRLALGASRTSIRPGSTFKRYKKAKPDLTFFEPGHGKQIWIFHHISTNQIVHSHKPVMDSNRAMKQLPFNGKKTKPAKLRRDYWEPMAMIQFSEGQELVGRSVFQKLREFRWEHEVSWGGQAEDLYALSKYHRGRALNDQKANTIADMAAVLGGAGQGNRIWMEDEEASKKQGDETAKRLAEATIYWASPYDRAHAESWPSNVTHQLGLPTLSSRPPKEGEELPKLEEVDSTLPPQVDTPRVETQPTAP